MCSTPGCVRSSRNNSCDLCQACYRRARRLADPEVAEAARESCRRAWTKKTGKEALPRAERFPERTPDQNFEVYLVSVYGLTLARYRELEAAQGGVCKICKKSDTSKKRKLHVDHNHLTGVVRGLLCHNCNVGLGAFRDSKTNLQNALDYIVASE